MASSGVQLPRRSLVPVLVVLLSLVVTDTGAVLMWLGGSAVGATWDERIHALMTETGARHRAGAPVHGAGGRMIAVDRGSGGGDVN